MSTREMEMQNIIIIKGVRQSGVTTKANELKESIEGLGLGYKVAIVKEDGKFDVTEGKIVVERGIFHDYIIIERLKNGDIIKMLKMVANVKTINLEESDIIMRMIGEDLSKENVKKQIGNYLDFKRHYVDVVGKWD